MPFNPITGMDEDEENLVGSNLLPDTAPIIPPEIPNQDGVQPQPIEMNPLVKDHVMKKFNLGDYTNEKRAELAKDSELGFGDRIGAALAAIGAGFQGKDSAAAAQAKLSAARAAGRQKLEDFDKGRANQIQEYGLNRQLGKDEREDELLKREMDPNSQESQMADELARSMGYKGGPITAQQFKAFSPYTMKKYEIEQKALDRKEARDERRFQAGLKMKEKQQEGLRDVDKAFAKDYNDWTSGDQASVDRNLDRLQKAKETLEKRKNDMIGTSGGFTGRLPDWLRSEESKTIRQDVQAAAQGALKATLGSQFTEREGERIMKNAYDETLSPEANIAKIDSAIKELETAKNNKNAKASYFEKNGTLSGLNPISSANIEPKDSAGKKIVKTQTNPKTGAKRVVYSDGTTEIISSTAGN